MMKSLIQNQWKKPTDLILFWLYLRHDTDSGQTALPWTKDQRAGQHWGNRPSPGLMEGISNWIQAIPAGKGAGSWHKTWHSSDWFL